MFVLPHSDRMNAFTSTEPWPPLAILAALFHFVVSLVPGTAVQHAPVSPTGVAAPVFLSIV